MIVVVVIVIRIGRTGGHCSPPARQSQYHDSPLEAGKPVSMFQNSTDNEVLRSSNRMCPIKNFLSEYSVLVLFDCPVRATFPFFRASLFSFFISHKLNYFSRLIKASALAANRCAEYLPWSFQATDS